MMSKRFEFQSRSFDVPVDGVPLGQAIRGAHPGASWNDAKRLIASGKVAVNGSVTRNPGVVVSAGATLSIRMNSPARGIVSGRALLVHVDSDLVVAEKPSGLSTVPYDEREKDTLESRVKKELKRLAAAEQIPAIHTVHRIDKETTGLVVFARNRSALRNLKQQFRAHSVERRYRAIAHGTPISKTIDTHLVPDRGDGLRGSTHRANQGQRAVTHVESIEALEGATLVLCRLETGRTHQIRIHLSEDGHPLLGEKVYTRGYAGELLSAVRLMLHAETLGFAHPTSGEVLNFRSELPEDMLKRIARLRTTADARLL